MAAVQQTSIECRRFVGVYVEQCPEDETGCNWRIKGIKYGSVAREPCDAALAEIVRTLKERYVVEGARNAMPTEVAAEAAAPAPARVSPLAAARRRLTQNS